MTFDELIDYYGTQIAVAKKLGVTKGAVNQWKDAGIPPGRQFQIATLTGQVLRVDSELLPSRSDAA